MCAAKSGQKETECGYRAEKEEVPKQKMLLKDITWNNSNQSCINIIRAFWSTHQHITGIWTVEKVQTCDASITHHCKHAKENAPCIIIFAKERSAALALRL